MKYTIITKSIDPTNYELYETEVDCDNIFLDPTSKFVMCMVSSGIKLPDQHGQQQPVGAIVKWFNTEYVVEVHLKSTMSKVLKMIEN